MIKPKPSPTLDALIDAVAESYEAPLPINNLESAELPNRQRVLAAIRDLEASLFLGFFASRGLTRENLRSTLAELLTRVFQNLELDIERALRYEEGRSRSPRCPKVGSGSEIVVELLRAVPTLRLSLNGDLEAAFKNDPAAESIEEVAFAYPSIRAVTAYRIAHLLQGFRVPLIPRIITEEAHSKTGIDIHPGASIGERFFIDHGTGVVIGETTVIHNNVKLYQGVTLGALSVPDRGATRVKRHPTLEDEVTVYAGATILGGDTKIGRGAVIGGNVWLTESVDAGAKVFGGSRTR